MVYPIEREMFVLCLLRTAVGTLWMSINRRIDGHLTVRSPAKSADTM